MVVFLAAIAAINVAGGAALCRVRGGYSGRTLVLVGLMVLSWACLLLGWRAII